MGRNIGVLSLIFVGMVSGCGEIDEEAASGSQGDFCETALARVDSFMATLPQGGNGEDDRYGGMAVVGAVGELPGGMNAFLTAESVAAQHQQFVNLMTLVQFDEELNPMPYLARSWDLSEDGSVLTFHLRDDVVWHDGSPTTGLDLEFTFLRATDPATAYPNASLWSGYISGPDGVEVVDSFTVRFHLARPHADFMVPWQALAIMPRHLLEGIAPEELRNHPFGTQCPVGNGPFRFVSHSPGDRWVFEANPAFPEELGGRPFLDRYVYRIIPEAATLLAELLTGTIDLFVSVPPNQASTVLASEDLSLVAFPYRSVAFVAWNHRRPHLSDSRVRRAITYATNRELLLEGIREGRGILANAGVPPMHYAYDPGMVDLLPFDPDMARALLSEAGWRDEDGDGIRENAEGVPLEFSLKYNPNQERQAVAEILQAQLIEVGIRVRPIELEFGTLIGQITNPESRDFDGVVLSWEVGFQVDETDLFHSGAIDGPMAFAGLQDPELDRLLDTLQLVPNQAEALPLWREYQERVVELQPFMYLYFPDRVDGVNRRLQGAQMDLRGEWTNVGKWWVSR
jgi:peptide/nickel transport system substrate-binding protein